MRMFGKIAPFQRQICIEWLQLLLYHPDFVKRVLILVGQTQKCD